MRGQNQRQLEEHRIVDLQIIRRENATLEKISFYFIIKMAY
jgi:hypothetical protein